MKKRMRYYIRQGWTVIDTAHPYHDMRSWCEQNFEKDVWAASLYGLTGESRFAFKRPADAALFSLRWL